MNANDILSRVELSSRNNDLPPYMYFGRTDLCCSPLRDPISLFWSYVLLGGFGFFLCFMEKMYSSQKIFRGAINTQNELSVARSEPYICIQYIFVL